MAILRIRDGMRLLFISRRIDRRQPGRRAALAATLVVLALPGCRLSSPPASVIHHSAALQGHVLGAQQPVSGASILLYAAGTAGPGVGAINLLGSNAVTTDGSGYFSLNGDFECPTVSTQVYVMASGGHPALLSGGSNPALAMMAALGDCGELTSSSSVTIDEATTVAAAWALSQFIGPGDGVGSASSNATGLANAFAVASNLVDTTTGLAPGAALPQGATTETAKLNTLANALAACVNSSGGAACAPLFAAASTSETVPANALDAALNIVRHPANHVAAVYAAGALQSSFRPVLGSGPHDWTMSITYGGCAPGCGGLNLPGSLAIDSAGNVLVANYFGGVVSKFSPTGVPAAGNGISGVGLHESYGIAIDGLDNVWVTNEQSVTAANNHHDGSISEFSAAGIELSGDGYTGGGVYYPLGVAADANGSIWIADYGSSSATLLAGDGSAISGSSGYGASQLPFASAVAVDASHNAWFAVQGGAVRVTAAGAVSSYACCEEPDGIAVDGLGDVWIADYTGSAVVELSPSGSVLHRTLLLNGNGGPQGIAIDGAGEVWAANFYGNSLVELDGTTAAVLSASLGYGLDAPIDEPYGLAIDASGNLWLSNAGANTLTQIVGLASPVRTPLLGPAVQP
jgi:streptogramin lyase